MKSKRIQTEQIVTGLTRNLETFSVILFDCTILNGFIEEIDDTQDQFLCA